MTAPIKLYRVVLRNEFRQPYCWSDCARITARGVEVRGRDGSWSLSSVLSRGHLDGVLEMKEIPSEAAIAA